MALDLEEQEQLEELKEWWRKHGNPVLAVLTVIVLAVAGWRGYEIWSTRQATAALALYEQALQASQAKNAMAVRELTGKIMDSYSHSGYAVPAAWLAGKTNYDDGDLKSAAAQYRYALDHAGDPGLKQLASLRLAEVLLDQKDYAGALKLVEGKHDAQFVPLFANLKGDVLVAQGKPADARAAYQLALDKLDANSPLKAVVEIKLDGVGG